MYSTGTDELHPKILGQIAKYIAASPTVIFNTSLNQGELPTNWKDVVVTVIHKAGSRQFTSNYIPVSLTGIVVKILERIIKKTY